MFKTPLALAAAAAVLAACGAGSDDGAAVTEPTPVSTTTTVELADEATLVIAAASPIWIEITFDDGVEVLTARVETDPVAASEVAATPESGSQAWCSAPDLDPGAPYSVKVDNTAADPGADLLWAEVESLEPVDGPGTYPAAVFMLLQGGTSLSIDAAELVLDDGLGSGSFAGVSASGVRISGAFGCV